MNSTNSSIVMMCIKFIFNCNQSLNTITVKPALKGTCIPIETLDLPAALLSLLFGCLFTLMGINSKIISVDFLL
jgi:hypothetical protein